jgi:CRISPR-associated protein Csx3
MPTAHPPLPLSFQIGAADGLRLTVFAHGAPGPFEHAGTLLGLLPGNPLEPGLLNLYLRVHRPGGITALPLLTTCDVFTADNQNYTASGAGLGFTWQVSLTLDPGRLAWLWRVEARGQGLADVVYVQDTGLGDRGFVLGNESFTSQYVDFTALDGGCRGWAVCARQNLAQGGRHPWLLLGSPDRVTGFLTDGLSFFGPAYRLTGTPDALQHRHFPNRVRQQELGLVALVSARRRAVRGQTVCFRFHGLFQPHHAEPSGAADLACLPELTRWANRQPAVTPGTARTPSRTLFATAPLAPAAEPTDADLTAWLGAERRQPEPAGPAEPPLSFFTGAATHVVRRAKEGIVERAHAHILQTHNTAATADARIMSSTCFMFGACHSHITFGNTRFNKLLGIPRGQLNLTRSAGQRIFVRHDTGWQLLGVPSAFAMEPNRCRWFYRLPERLIEVAAWSDPDGARLGLDIRIQGAPAELLITQLLCVGVAEYDSVPTVLPQPDGAVLIRPDPATDFGRHYPHRQFRLRASPLAAVTGFSDDAALQADGLTRANPCLVLHTQTVADFRLEIVGEDPDAGAPASGAGIAGRLDGSSAAAAGARASAGWRAGLALRGAGLADELNEILPWFVQNARVHYLTPHGLEQYGGAAWGTRDICQGPLELLLALGHDQAARTTLLRVYAAQNPDGTWPQWFMFDAYDFIRAGDAHGDVILWPLKALTAYLEATSDFGILQATVPWGGPEAPGPQPLLAHLTRQIGHIRGSFVPDTALMAFGDGDWDDSLQPADPAFKRRLISSWTVALSYQVFTTAAEALRRAGLPDLAARLSTDAAQIRADFNRILMPDGIVAGFVLRRDDGAWEPMLHPADRRTGMHYRLLPMTRAILGGLFTPAQARDHHTLIRRHLLAADGARLMDAPPRYQGGRQTHFQRAETSSCFGREIGLMYMHAQIRYAEALGRLGAAAALGEAIRRVVPLNLAASVPTALPRQCNTYFTSSDAAFDTRYDAGRAFNRVFTGDIAFRGGWRVYSSGPGIFVHLVVATLLGLRRYYDTLVIDPVLPPGCDGLQARLVWAGQAAAFTFRAGATDAPVTVHANGTGLAGTRAPHPYRGGGASLSRTAWQALASPGVPLQVDVSYPQGR